MKYSIVIPTYNHCDDLLKPCIDSILKHTLLNSSVFDQTNYFEIIIVANGCTDNTREYTTNLKKSYDNISLVWFDEPLGYTKATNEGIKVAKGDYIILVNNDIVLLDNSWIHLLEEPFKKDPLTGITGPVKFSWDCGGTLRNAMAFWLVMISKEMFTKFGLLDEIFSPGMGEDGDFSIKVEDGGYKLISVPNDVTGEFERGIVNFAFPVMHIGNGTFGDDNAIKESIIQRNNDILAERYGSKNEYCIPSSYRENQDILYFEDAMYDMICQREVYQYVVDKLNGVSNVKILDIGCGSAYKLVNYLSNHEIYGADLPETIKFLNGKYPDGRWIELDVEKEELQSPYNNIVFDYVICSDVIEHLKDPNKLLNLLKNIKSKTIILSTPDRALLRERDLPRLGPPMNKHHIREWTKEEFAEYLKKSGFIINYHEIVNFSETTQLVECQGTYNFNKEILIAEESKEETNRSLELPKLIDISIVIPTCNKLNEALKPCLEAVFAYTDMSNKEVIVVPNGSPKELLDHLGSYGDKIRVFPMSESSGYIRPVNLGVSKAKGKYVILLDDDSILLYQEKDNWINILMKPFLENIKTGASSPFANWYPEFNKLVLHSGCTMYDRKLLIDVGMFDQGYNPGYMSDSDVSLKIWKVGRTCVEVPENMADKPYENGTFRINFPVYHSGTVQTMDKQKDVALVTKNREHLIARHTKEEKMKKKYSIIIPTYNHCDDLLKPAVESIINFTDLSQTEVIIVANGCTDNTRSFVEGLGDPFKLIWVDEAIGFTRATNMGIKESEGDFIVLFNNDCILLDQRKNSWLEEMESIVVKPGVGLTGPLELFDEYAQQNVLIFFCVMIRRDLFEKIGLLDEIFSPGGGEDIDFSIRARQAGYDAVPLQYVVKDEVGENVGHFPIWHRNNKTFGEIPEYTKVIVKKNGLVNALRYNTNLKLNLGAGGIEYPGYLSVDMYDPRANIIMDIANLTFKDNTAVEILASHVFEHLNPYHSVATLADWRRVLKPGGKLIMEMPDIEQLCKRFTESKSTGERYGILNAIYGSVNTTNSGEPSDITSPHLFGWWPESLHDHLTNAGYGEIKFMSEKIPHPESNLRVEAIKLLPEREFLQAHQPMLWQEIFHVNHHGYNSYGCIDEEIRGKTVLDIGANIGYFSLYCVERGAKHIIAVEAQPTVFNSGLVPLTDQYRSQITPLNFAAYSENDLTVKIPNNHVGSAIGEEGEEVKTITLETLSKMYPKASVLKLDVEGSEYNVMLNTSAEVLRKFEVIYMEVHCDINPNPAYRGNDILTNHLGNSGFRFVGGVQMFGGHNREIPMNVRNEKWVRI